MAGKGKGGSCDCWEGFEPQGLRQPWQTQPPIPATTHSGSAWPASRAQKCNTPSRTSSNTRSPSTSAMYSTRHLIEKTDVNDSPPPFTPEPLHLVGSPGDNTSILRLIHGRDTGTGGEDLDGDHNRLLEVSARISARLKKSLMTT